MQTILLNKQKGWTLIEALERTTCSDLWHHYLEAKQAYETSLVPRGSDLGGYLIATVETKRRLRAVRDEAFNRIVTPFKQQFLDERLFAWGSKEMRSSPPTAVYSGGWKSITCDFGKNRIKDRSGGSVVFHDVRVFPLAFDSSFETRLAGLSLAEAFKLCVLEDPEVVAIHTFLNSMGALENDQRFPERYLDMKWPVTLSAESLAMSFVRGPATVLGGREAFPSDLGVRQAEVLCSRWRALMGVLASGAVGADATFKASGVSQPIGRQLWNRTDLCIDVRNGDLIGGDTYPKPAWTGVELSLRPLEAPIAIADTAKPIPVRVAKPKPRARSPYPKPTTPADKRTHSAVIKLWRGGIPDGLQRKVVVHRVNAQLKEMNLPEVSAKSISRYLNKKRR
jgi:hypothetical protein